MKIEFTYMETYMEGPRLDKLMRYERKYVLNNMFGDLKIFI